MPQLATTSLASNNFWVNGTTSTTSTAITYTANVEWVWSSTITSTATTWAALDNWVVDGNKAPYGRAKAPVMQRLKLAARQHGRDLSDLFIELLLAEIGEPDFVPTPEELREVQDEHQRAAEVRREQLHQQRVRQEEVAAADARAEKLLISVLSTEQKREWLEHRRVTEVAPSGRTWRFLPVWAGGALIMDETNPEVRRATLCVHPGERVPDADSIVALLMHLRSGEEDLLLQLAIVHNGKLTPEENEIRSRRQRRRMYHQEFGGEVNELIAV